MFDLQQVKEVLAAMTIPVSYANSEDARSNLHSSQVMGHTEPLKPGSTGNSEP
jgi:hypothetical protein